MKQTSVEWLMNELRNHLEMRHNHIEEILEEAKEMHKQEIIDAINDVSENNVNYANKIVSQILPIEGQLFTHNNKLAEKYYQETFVSNGSDECQFEPTTNTSSATICKHCGREKFLHTT